MPLLLTENEQNHTSSNGYQLNHPTDPPPCLHDLLETVTERHSHKTALICGSSALTFGELNALANNLARGLIQRGTGNGDLVGVAVDRSVELAAVMLAVLKTGAAYVPIEPSLPVDRINQMVEDSGLKLLISGSNALEGLELPGIVSCLSIEEVLQTTNSKEKSCGKVHSAVRSDDLAYVMYTSGSTGRPKGVEVTHGSVSNLLLSMRKEPGCDETDRLLAITTVSFDMAVLELFLPLLCGATTIIAQKHQVRDPAALVGLLTHHRITMMQGTPVIWQMLLESGWRGQPRLAKILCGGEALSRKLADRLLACGDMIWNMYGPTEATVYASIWRVCHDHDVIVGGPVDNAYLYVLDDDLSPMPPGSPGELYIGGAGVARGYRNNTELTRSRFLDNPFHHGLMYRTGDLARFTAPSELAVMGRLDAQVKIRGHRIELGEIEAVLSSYDGIAGAVVVCRGDRLAAYYVRTKQQLANGGSEVKATMPFDRLLRSWLADRLPEYMVPAFFLELQAFPVTMNGKVDRNVLPDPAQTVRPAAATMMPTTELERKILEVWSSILDHNYFGISDNFFEVGGDSVRLIRVQRQLEGLLGRQVPSPILFENYTIKMLAAHLTSSTDSIGASSPNTNLYGVADDTGQDIAIISTACRLPGGVTTPEDFWELLESGGDGITDVPKDRWDADLLYDASPDALGKSYCRRGGFIPLVGSFDASFFGISPREARTLDPSQYMMLETCWEGLERAGYTTDQLRDSQTGVFIGTSNILAHQGLNPTAARFLEDLDGYTVTGSAGGTISGRISYQLGFQGPSMTIDTACSSSLVATHLACNALRRGECDMAVCGGISLMLNPGLHVEFSRLQGMSPDGRCRSFSEDTEGTGWSEGSVVVVLKRLSDAQRDGDAIQAVIRSTAVNHDGRTATLSTPSGPAQQRLVRTALSEARLRPDDIDYIEAHGTGTKLGDPIEATALAGVFGPGRSRREPLLIGSVKSNIGHTQAAAGLAGLLKVTLALQHSNLPQSLHVSKPTPAVDWKGVNMLPALAKQPWLSHEGRLRRAGVSAFGIGGTNAHVIIEEAPRELSISNHTKTEADSQYPFPFLLSGDTNAALIAQAGKLHRRLGSPEMSDCNLPNVAYSLATTRNHFRRRLAMVAQDKSELLDQLRSNSQPDSLDPLGGSDSSTETPRLAMIFTGQGSQWPGMGKDLCDVYPVFGKMVRDIAAEFDSQLDLPLLQVMWAAPGSTAALLLERTDFAQAALFTVEVALWQLWKAWGVTPDFVFGHSLGELVAAHVAGVLDLSDACRLVAARGRLMQSQSGDCSMVSIEASATEVATAVDQLGHNAQVEIALYNTPTQTVISGTTDSVEQTANYFSERGCKIKTVMTGHAFHSRHMDGMLLDFKAVAKTVQFNPARISVFSSRYGRLVETGELEHADYWVNQVREPVHFSDGIRGLAGQGVNIFLEVGPHHVLCGLGAACLAVSDNGDSTAWLPSLSRGKDSVLTLQHSVIQLHLRNLPIDWEAYFEPFGCQRVQLPTYAFQRTSYLKQLSGRQRQEAAVSLNDIGTRHSTGHTLHGNQTVCQFEVAWQAAQTGPVHFHGTWGLVIPAGNTAWVGSVTTVLSRQGIRLAQVEHLRHAESLAGLVCLWDSDSDMILQMREVVGKALVQLQTAAEVQFTPPIIWITRQAVGTSIRPGDGAMRPGAGPLLWGLMRTARSEHPELRLRLIDLDDEPIDGGVGSALMLSTEPECAVHYGQVLVPRMQEVGSILPNPPLAKHHLVRPDGTVLITGGLGHLGARVARWLASDHGIRNLVLTSRQGMDAPGAAALVSELSSLGASVIVMAGNIANLEFVDSIVAICSKNRPLRGVVHAAGLVDSGVLSSMTQERCKATLEPKAYGAWLLHQATEKLDLDLFLMFSSISGALGMPGLANYAAANTFLDALAHLRRGQGLSATSVAYGTWAGEGGMAARLGQTTVAHLSQFGLHPLTPAQGIDLLEQAVVSTRALTVAAALDLSQLQQFYKDQGGSIPPLLSSLFVKANNTATQSPRPGRRLMRELLDEVRPEQHLDIVLKTTQQVVAQALGFTDPLSVETNRPLKEIGIDSLTAVQIRNHLATRTGLKLSVNIAVLHPNLMALSQSLLSQLQDSGTPSTKTTAALVNFADVSKICLDSHFTFAKPVQNSSSKHFKATRVFLTGATGFVGAFILYELLLQSITTYCLVRTDCINEARQRVVGTLQEYGLWDPIFTPLIKPVVGDISQPLLGLSEALFLHIADRVDAICHSGALVDWMRPLQDYIGPNIISAHEILRMASRGRIKTVHLVSTISTLPKHMGLDLREEDLEYGYGTSKFIAERLVSAARWRGARASIYRLPYVTASTTSGHFRHDRGDFLHNLVAGSLEMGTFPILDADLSAVLPVDYLAKTIVSVMTAGSRHLGRDWDFLNTRAPTCTEFFQLMCANSDGVSRELIQFGLWKQRAVQYASKHPTSPLARIAAILDGYTDETAPTMFKSFSVGENVFGDDEFPAPPIDKQFVSAYLGRISTSLA